MTTASIMNLSRSLGTASAKGVDANGELAKKAEDVSAAMFGSLMNQFGRADTWEAEPKPVQVSASVSSDTRPVDYAERSYPARGASIAEARPVTVRERVQESEGTLEETGKQILSAIQEQLDVSKEEVEDVLEALGLSVFDLFDPGRLGEVVKELTNIPETSQLLMNPDFQVLVGEVGAVRQELVQAMELKPEEFDELVAQMERPQPERLEDSGFHLAMSSQADDAGELPVSEQAVRQDVGLEQTDHLERPVGQEERSFTNRSSLTQGQEPENLETGAAPERQQPAEAVLTEERPEVQGGPGEKASAMPEEAGRTQRPGSGEIPIEQPSRMEQPGDTVLMKPEEETVSEPVFAQKMPEELSLEEPEPAAVEGAGRQAGESVKVDYDTFAAGPEPVESEAAKPVRETVEVLEATAPKDDSKAADGADAADEPAEDDTAALLERLLRDRDAGMEEQEQSFSQGQGFAGHSQPTTASRPMQHTENPFLQVQQASAGDEVVPAAIPREGTSYASVDPVELIRQVVQNVRTAVQNQVTSLEMQLNPEHLGKVLVHLTSREGAVSAQFAAANEAVRAALEAQIADLRENLNQAGVKVDAIEVTVGTHEFEQNLEQNARGEAEQSEQQGRQQRGRRNLSLDALDELSGIMTEEERLVAQMMLDNGNSMDVTA